MNEFDNEIEPDQYGALTYGNIISMIKSARRCAEKGMKKHKERQMVIIQSTWLPSDEKAQIHFQKIMFNGKFVMKYVRFHYDWTHNKNL